MKDMAILVALKPSLYVMLIVIDISGCLKKTVILLKLLHGIPILETFHKTYWKTSAIEFYL